MNYFDSESILSAYGSGVGEFNKMRRRLDPEGMWANEYLRERLGE